MWTKSFRYLIFTSLYQVLFWREQGENNPEIDFESIVSTVQINDIIDFKSAEIVLENYYKNEKELTEKLIEVLDDWDKTFIMIKACLYSFLLEKMDIQNSGDFDEVQKIISKYIRLSEELIGGKNVKLIHAVLIKFSK